MISLGGLAGVQCETRNNINKYQEDPEIKVSA